MPSTLLAETGFRLYKGFRTFLIYKLLTVRYAPLYVVGLQQKISIKEFF